MQESRPLDPEHAKLVLGIAQIVVTVVLAVVTPLLAYIFARRAVRRQFEGRVSEQLYLKLVESLLEWKKSVDEALRATRVLIEKESDWEEGGTKVTASELQGRLHELVAAIVAVQDPRRKALIYEYDEHRRSVIKDAEPAVGKALARLSLDLTKDEQLIRANEAKASLLDLERRIDELIDEVARQGPLATVISR
jgi:hypothetical protein